MECQQYLQMQLLNEQNKYLLSVHQKLQQRTHKYGKDPLWHWL